jgi:hypothetical protein
MAVGGFVAFDRESTTRFVDAIASIRKIVDLPIQKLTSLRD